jgi:hypothetical protein
MNVCEAIVAALVAVGQPGVVDAIRFRVVAFKFRSTISYQAKITLYDCNLVMEMPRL